MLGDGCAAGSLRARHRDHWGDRVDPSDDSGKNRIVIILQTCKNIGDEFIVTKRGARHCKLISVMGHLGVVVGNRELILLGSSERNCVFTDRAHDCDE
jgi:hypothetical protein